MIAIFILEVAGGIAGYMLSSKAEVVLRTNMIRMLPEYMKASGPWNKHDWDNMQSNVSIQAALGNKTG